MTRYNKKDREAARQHFRDAVWFLRQNGARWKAIAYALRVTPERVKTLYVRECNRRECWYQRIKDNQ